MARKSIQEEWCNYFPVVPSFLFLGAWQPNGHRERSIATAYNLVKACGLVAAGHRTGRRMVDSLCFLSLRPAGYFFTAFSFTFHVFSKLNRATDSRLFLWNDTVILCQVLWTWWTIVVQGKRYWIWKQNTESLFYHVLTVNL